MGLGKTCEKEECDVAKESYCGWQKGHGNGREVKQWVLAKRDTTIWRVPGQKAT